MKCIGSKAAHKFCGGIVDSHCDGCCNLADDAEFAKHKEALDAALRAEKAEGLREAARLVGDKATTLLRRASEYEREGRAWDAEYQRGKALELAAAALLARAEEVERGN